MPSLVIIHNATENGQRTTKASLKKENNLNQLLYHLKKFWNKKNLAGHGYGYHFSVANLLTHCKNNKESNKTNSNNSVYRLGNLLFESERYKIKKICVKNWWFTNTSSYKKRIINQGIFWGHMVWRAWLIRGYVKKKWVEYFNPKEAPFLCRNQKMMRVIIRHGEMVVVFAGRPVVIQRFLR